MDYTDGQKAQFKITFAARRRKQRLLAVPLIALFIGFAVVRDRNQGELFGFSVAVWGPIFVLLVAGAVIFSFVNWKCPACNRYLGKSANPTFCSKCGVALR